MKSRKYLIGLAAMALPIFVFSACGSSNGGGGNNSGLNGTASINGSVVDTDGNAVAGATVFIPGEPVKGVSLGKSISVSCEGHGGEISCEDPSETSCASTCTCLDGTYILNASQCPSDASDLKVCYGGNCQDVPIDCGGQASCAIEVTIPGAGEVCAPVNAITMAICDRILSCQDENDYSIQPQHCYDVLPPIDDTYGVRFGLRGAVTLDGTASDGQNLEGVCEMLQMSMISYHAENLTPCLNAISSVSCASIPEVDINNSNNSSGWNDIQYWIPESCGNGSNLSTAVFTDK